MKNSFSPKQKCFLFILHNLGQISAKIFTSELKLVGEVRLSLPMGLNKILCEDNK